MFVGEFETTLHSSALHLPVYEPMFVDVRRRVRDWRTDRLGQRALMRYFGLLNRCVFESLPPSQFIRQAHSPRDIKIAFERRRNIQFTASAMRASSARR